MNLSESIFRHLDLSKIQQLSHPILIIDYFNGIQQEFEKYIMKKSESMTERQMFFVTKILLQKDEDSFLILDTMFSDFIKENSGIEDKIMQKVNAVTFLN